VSELGWSAPLHHTVHLRPSSSLLQLQKLGIRDLRKEVDMSDLTALSGQLNI